MVSVNPREALDQVRQVIGENATTSYTRNRCRVSLHKIPSDRVVLDVDRMSPTDRAMSPQCDLILFYADTFEGSLVAVPMELKSGNVDASDAIKQLQGGVRFIERLVPKTVKTNCIPVLVYGSKTIQKRQHEKLRRARITFRSEEILIQTTRCSYEGNLAKALNIK